MYSFISIYQIGLPISKHFNTSTLASLPILHTGTKAVRVWFSLKLQDRIISANTNIINTIKRANLPLVKNTK